MSRVRRTSAVADVFVPFLRLGLTSFGGPVAHIAYFRTAFVERLAWLDDGEFARLVAICQAMPGPASSQLGMAIGMLRGGMPGLFAAWLGFTLPSAVLMVALAVGVTRFGEVIDPGLLIGLKIAATAVVAHALIGMSRALCPDRPRQSLALAAGALVLLVPGVIGQVAVIVAAGLAGRLLALGGEQPRAHAARMPVSARTAALALAAALGLLVALPMIAALTQWTWVALTEGFYRAGALVFGGGHVLLPLLQPVVLEPGWVSSELFLAGYGAAQAMPGPLFTFAGYLGAVYGATVGEGALLTAVGFGFLALGAIFLPSMLLVVGVIPLAERLLDRRGLRGALVGINAGVVGLLVGAFYDPVWVSSILGPAHLALALVAFALLAVWRWPPWLVVVLSGGAAMALPVFA